MNKQKQRQASKERRQTKIRVKINGTASRPRICVTRSLKHVYLQAIDDLAGKTLVGLSDKGLKIKGTKTEKATAVGKLMAEKLLALKVKRVVFDRSGRKYHGRVKAAAEGAREGGLKF